jgi:hypothetical protein
VDGNSSWITGAGVVGYSSFFVFQEFLSQEVPEQLGCCWQKCFVSLLILVPFLLI